MTINKTVVSASMVLAMALSTPLFTQLAAAQTEAPEAMQTAPTAVTTEGEAVNIECISQAEVEAMTAEDKEKLTLPVCDESNEADNKAEEKNAE